MSVIYGCEKKLMHAIQAACVTSVSLGMSSHPDSSVIALFLKYVINYLKSLMN